MQHFAESKVPSTWMVLRKWCRGSNVLAVPCSPWSDTFLLRPAAEVYKLELMNSWYNLNSEI